MSDRETPEDNVTKFRLSRRAFGATALALGTAGLSFGAAQAQDAADQDASGDAGGGQGGPAVNDTVFRAGPISSVAAVTEVFGRSQRSTAAILEYDSPIATAQVSPDQFSVADRTITRAYANDAAAKADQGTDGRYVVLELDPQVDEAITFSPDVDTPAQIIVTQTGAVTTVDGQSYPADPAQIINTRQYNLIVDDFVQFRFADPKTGLLLDYNLFIPEDYDPAKPYPLVLFMHDLGVTGTNPLRTLEQGLGAVSFASPEDQARHPAFVLAPQYPAALANDAGQLSDYPEITMRLIEELTTRYSLDRKRIYTTGQSGGCMTSIALNIKYPEFFAASLLVAGQWNPDEVAPLAQKKLWVVVSQDDSKAYPGMQAIMSVLEENGAKVSQAVWNGRASAEEFAQDVAQMQADGPDSNVYFTAFEKGTVIPEGVGNQGASGHVWTWPIAYDIPGLRDWLLAQSL